MTAAAVERLPLPLLRSGKVREVYEVDANRLLLVASDRVMERLLASIRKGGLAISYRFAGHIAGGVTKTST